MSPPLLLLQEIGLTFGGAPLLDGAGLAVAAGERLCLVGRNGSGKSTLLRIAAGLAPFDTGSRFVQPGATIRYLPQEPDLSGFATTGAYVEAGLAPGDDPNRARYLLAQLGLSGMETPARLSGGEARRAALARTLAPAPDILLLDEPTNHLDLPAIAWLEGELARLRSALVLISHDRRLLGTLGRAVLWLDRGITRRMDQGFAGFEAWRDETIEQEEATRHKLGRKIAMEEDWLRYGVTARRRRNQKRLADLHALRRRHRETRAGTDRLRLVAAEAERSGQLVARAEGVAKALGGRQIVRGLDLRLLRGDRLGIVGPNGAGKTTLLRLLTGALAPDAGSIRLGASLAMVSLEQDRASLDPAMRLADALTGGGGDTVLVGTEKRHVVGYMKDFLFRPEQVGTPLGALSGGERGRLMLARAFATPSNLLVLDEPTNDLDLETLDLLQEKLADYTGTVLLVSHDRDFLDRVATSILAFEGEGRWVEYAGGYSDMLAQRGPAAARTPTGATAGAPRPRPAQAGETGASQGGSSPPVGAPARRMTFKDRHALQTLPAHIATLQARIAELSAVLTDADLYRRDPARFTSASATLAATGAELASAEDRWLTLEMLREELEG